MDFFDRMIMRMMYGRTELHWGAGAIGAIFFVLLDVALVVYGLVSGYWQWMVVGGILAVFNAILAIIAIILNIRKNSNRW